MEAAAENEYHFELPVTTEEDLADFLWTAFDVRIPARKVCPNHVSPWRAFCDAYFARHPVAVWKGSRGFSGKSFTLANLGLSEALLLKADVNILGGSGQQSKRVHEAMTRAWAQESAPAYLLASDPLKMESRLTWGNTIQALMASQNSVRGPHPQRLRLDEIDEMDLEILDAAMGQPMARPGIPAQTLLVSTHHNPQGTMTEILKRASEKGWPVYEWCYRETMAPHGWLPVDEVERKRGEITAEMWRVEYELGEPKAELRAILLKAVEAMFDRELGEFRGDAGEYIEIEPPVAGAQYATGADWARDVDWTVIVTLRIDVMPAKLVAFERQGRKPWPLMVQRLDARIRRYPGETCHDGTGLGSVVEDYLEEKAEAVTLQGRTRSSLFSEYIAAVEAGAIEAPLIDYMRGEHRFVANDDLYGTGHPPDTIVAGALAWRAKTMRAHGVRLL